MLERDFQAKLIKRIEKEFEGAIVLKNDPNYKQGIPDLAVFFDNGKWAALEVKKSATAPARPNQPYYVEKMNKMSYSAFIYPENEEEILDGMASTLRLKRETRVSKSK